MFRSIRKSGLIALSAAVGAGLFATQAKADLLFNYNVVVTGTLSDSSHIQGRTFVNNLVTVNQPDFAQSAQAGTGDTLTVAGSVTGSGLTMERGVFRHAGSLPGGFTMNLNGGSSSVTDATVSISNLASQITSAASYYDTLSASTVTPTSGNVTINTVGTGVNVFSVAASDLSLQNENVSVNTNSASAVIIKVTGTSFTFGNSEHVSTTANQKVIWYFPDATTLTLNDSVWGGSILAPKAALTAPNQNIEGGIYVKDFTQTAEVHLPTPSLNTGDPLYTGPAVPEPGIASAMLLGVGFGLKRRRAR